jgi:hypothetical protein
MIPREMIRRLAALCLALLLATPAFAARRAHDPVATVAPERLAVAGGEVPLYLSADWSRPLPDIVRAVIVLHGLLRDADSYWKTAGAARAAAGAAGAGTLLIVPQFLAAPDIAAHAVPDSVLRWTIGGWMADAPALGPAPVRSFTVLDAILARLADPARFPALRQVVLAGHSAGGQVVQRYAVLGDGAAALATRGVAMRYVVANPSSYVYLMPERPMPVDPAACPGFDRWKYGLAGAPTNLSPATLAARYARRDVVYLLGLADTDPAQRVLDRSCAAEAQGPERLARGMAYFIALLSSYPDGFAQHLRLVPGIGHSAPGMLNSACGRWALFDAPGCPPLPR